MGRKISNRRIDKEESLQVNNKKLTETELNLKLNLSSVNVKTGIGKSMLPQISFQASDCEKS